MLRYVSLARRARRGRHCDAPAGGTRAYSHMFEEQREAFAADPQIAKWNAMTELQQSQVESPPVAPGAIAVKYADDKFITVITKVPVLGKYGDVVANPTNHDEIRRTLTATGRLTHSLAQLSMRTEITVGGLVKAEDCTLDKWHGFRRWVIDFRSTAVGEGLDAKQLLHVILTEPAVAQLYPGPVILIAIGATIPTNSTVCESGFSCVNAQKGVKQSHLKTKHVDSRVRVSMAIKKRGLAKPVLPNYHKLNYNGYASRCYMSGKFKRLAALYAATQSN